MRTQNQSKDENKKNQRTGSIATTVLTAFSALMFLYNSSVVAGPNPEQHDAEAKVDLERVALRAELASAGHAGDRSRLSLKFMRETLNSGRRVSLIVRGGFPGWDQKFMAANIDFDARHLALGTEPVFVDLDVRMDTIDHNPLFDFAQARDMALVDLRFQNRYDANDLAKMVLNPQVDVFGMGREGQLYSFTKSDLPHSMESSDLGQFIRKRLFMSSEKLKIVSLRDVTQGEALTSAKAAESERGVLLEIEKAIVRSLEGNANASDVAVLNELGRAGYSVVDIGTRGKGLAERRLVKLVRRGAH